MRVNDGRLFFGEGESFSSVRRGCQLSDVMRVFCVPVTDWEEAVRLLQLCKAAIEGLEGRCAAEAGSHGEEV